MLASLLASAQTQTPLPPISPTGTNAVCQLAGSKADVLYTYKKAALSRTLTMTDCSLQTSSKHLSEGLPFGLRLRVLRKSTAIL